MISKPTTLKIESVLKDDGSRTHTVKLDIPDGKELTEDLKNAIITDLEERELHPSRTLQSIR